MKWTEVAIGDLRDYTGLKASMNNISKRIATLESGVKWMDKMPVDGDDKWKGFLMDTMVELGRLKLLLSSVQIKVVVISKGLSALTDKEGIVLRYFYINKEGKHLAKLMKILNIEKTEVYRLKDKALQKFVLHMYGLQDY